MLNLQPLIARFVDDVLRAIRGAALDELRAILASSELELQRRTRLAAPARVAPPSEAKRAPASRARLQLGPAALATPRSHPEPEPHSEITDPERLLAPPAPPPVSERVETPAPEEPMAEPEESPPSSPVPVAPVVVHAPGNAPARLRVGESLANTTGTGMVIRRAKKT